MARRTFRYSSTVKMPPPSLLTERAYVAEFYSAGSGTIPPLPWQTFPPPFSCPGERGISAQVAIRSPFRSLSRPIAIPQLPTAPLPHTESTKSDFVNGLLSPNKQRLRSEVRFPVVYQVLTITSNDINVPIDHPKISGSGLARASCTAAEAIFGKSTHSQRAGNRIIQFSTRLRL